jgi:hypothetical protein
MENSKKRTESETQEAQVPEAPGSGPLWKTQSGRVQGAMWKHNQKGKSRFTVAISRSYKGQNGEWQNVHFFDRTDLQDVKKVADDAIAYLTEVVEKVESV